MCQKVAETILTYTDGSLKSDENERVSNIIYNSYLKQPSQITLTDGRWIKYFYDGGGALLRTQYSTDEVWDYAGIIYKNGQAYQISSPEGRAVYTNGAWQYEFFYHDHLGNTRVAFRAKGNHLEKASETSFDPWGIVLNGAVQVNTVQNRFEFQGKEKERTFGLNRINLGARTFNPTIGRFDRVDPLADVFELVSPYSYVLNNPLIYLDPFGDSTVHVNNLNWQKFNPEKDDILLDAAVVRPASVGSQVMVPVTGFWGKADQFLNGNRVYGDGSNRMVDSRGILTKYPKPISGGAPDLSLAKGITILKLLKFLMDFRNAKSAFKLGRGGSQTVYRVFGGDARAQGYSWTTVNPTSVKDFRNLAGLPSGGTSGAMNTADFMIVGKVNTKNIINSRSALPLDGNIGGLPELIIDPKNVKLIDFIILKP